MLFAKFVKISQKIHIFSLSTKDVLFSWTSSVQPFEEETDDREGGVVVCGAWGVERTKEREIVKTALRAFYRKNSCVNGVLLEKKKRSRHFTGKIAALSAL